MPRLNKNNLISGVVLKEFACGVFVCGSLGAVMAYLGLLWRPHHASLLLAVPGCWLLGLALNATPLLLHTLSLVRCGTARREVAAELAHPERYKRRYAWQSALFLVTPGAVLILAILQTGRSREGTVAMGTRTGTQARP